MIIGLALAMLAPNEGVVAIEGLAVGQVRNGKWRTCDQGTKDPAGNAPTKEAYTLSIGGKLSPATCTLQFMKDEPEGLQAWYVEPTTEAPATWFGPKPPAPKMIVGSPSSPTYLKVLGDYLKAKGVKGAKPRLTDVVLTDLDGDGTREAVLFAASRKEDEMWNTLSLDGEPKHPMDYAGVLVRYVSGKKTKIVELVWSDGRKGSLDGFWRNCGIWNLDGRPGAEILIGSRYYEGHGGLVFGFKKGKVTKLAENVVGV